MLVVMIPDSIGRKPTVYFYENEDFTPYRDYVFEKFDSLNVLIHILLTCWITAPYMIKRIDEEDTWILESLNNTYIIKRDGVYCTLLFKSWGLEQVIRKNEDGSIRLL